MNKQPDVTEATRKKIIDAFWSMFSRKDLDRITASALSLEAGIHRSSFYRYFPDVYTVLVDAQKDLLDYLKKEILKIQKENDISFFVYSEKIAALLTNSSNKIYRLLKYKSSAFRECFTETIKPNIEDFIQIDNSSPLKEYISSFIINAMLFNFTYWYEHQDQTNLSEVIDLGKSIVLNGLKKNGITLVL